MEVESPTRLTDLVPAALVGAFERCCRREQFISGSLMIVSETFGRGVAPVVVVHQGRPYRVGDHAVAGFELGEPAMRNFAPLPDFRGGQIMLIGDSAELVWFDIQVLAHTRLVPPASYLGFIVPPSQRWGPACMARFRPATRA
nr:hypothetical protein [Nocardia abscessus]